jgi:hypothetical protein
MPRKRHKPVPFLFSNSRAKCVMTKALHTSIMTEEEGPHAEGTETT